MTLEDVRTSLSADKPPAELSPALLGLSWDGKSDWRRAHESAQQDEAPEGSWVHAYPTLHDRSGKLTTAPSLLTLFVNTRPGSLKINPMFVRGLLFACKTASATSLFCLPRFQGSSLVTN
jgi:hypothetical protein